MDSVWDAEEVDKYRVPEERAIASGLNPMEHTVSLAVHTASKPAAHLGEVRTAGRVEAGLVLTGIVDRNFVHITAGVEVSVQ